MLALGLGLYARHWLLLAERNGVGARSEDAWMTLSTADPESLVQMSSSDRRAVAALVLVALVMPPIVACTGIAARRC